MPPKQPSPPAPAAPDVAGYDEEHVPFDGVMRKLANTKPPHKAAKSLEPVTKKK